MPTAHRRLWMREYMQDYRQGKLRRDEAQRLDDHEWHDVRKAVHRFDSFKWRLSQQLSCQYEILLCIQYTPIKGTYLTKDRKVLVYGGVLKDMKDVIKAFPSLKRFKACCDTGGGEIFKVFLIEKFNTPYNQKMICVVGVLDKSALLDNLLKLPVRDYAKLERIIKKVEVEAKRKKGWWHQLDFSRGSGIWIAARTRCYLLKWTNQEHPCWKSLELHTLLSKWETGTRRKHSRRKEELIKENDKVLGKLVISPILEG